MKCHDAVQFPYLYTTYCFLYTFLNVLSGFSTGRVYHIEIVELLAKLMNNSSKTPQYRLSVLNLQLSTVYC